ncbi:MAG: LysR family transcriptional regulator [Burkholderiales bacterium]
MLSSRDLALVAALAQGRSIRGAAELMGVHPSTVFRRLEYLEGDLGVRLFERFRDGYVPTAAGEELCAIARRTEEALLQAESRLRGRDMRPSGLVRVTTTDTLLASILGPVLASFRREHPDVELEVAVSNQSFDLIRRDADVAVRPTLDPPQNLVGRRVGQIAFAIYASPACLSRNRGTEMPLADQPWIGLDASLSHIRAAQWLGGLLKGRQPPIRTNSLLGAMHAARAGLGLALLPCYLGDLEPALERVGEPIRDLAASLWLLTHPDLRRVARVKAFMDFCLQALQDKAPAMEGQPSRAPKRSVRRAKRP